MTNCLQNSDKLFTDSWTFCGQILVDKIYTFEEISDKLFTDLLTFVDKICGQIYVIKFLTDFVDKLYPFFWQHFLDRFYRQTTNLDIDIFVDKICRQICTALTNIFSTYLLKRISKIFFSTRGRESFFVGQTFVLFWQTCWKEYHRFSFQQGGERDKVNPQGKISTF